MKVLIDARPLQTYSKFRGIGRYVTLLIDVFGNDDSFCFLFFKEKDIDYNAKNIILIKSPRRGITFTDNFFLPQIFKNNNIDVYHSTAYALPVKTKNVKYILTFYDITPLKYPEYLSKKNLFIFKRIIKSTNRADKICTISENSKQDLISYTNVPKINIDVVYPALNIRQISFINQKREISDEYLLYVGGLDGNKNVTTIMKAVNLLDVSLIIAGAVTKEQKNVLLSNLDKGKRKNVVFTGYVSENELQNLYKYAKIFLFPSLYEGFGFTPLEALINGTPSIVSKCGSIPEVLGDAAYYVDDPLDYKELTKKIDILWNDSKLRKKIVKNGKEISNKYSIELFKSQMETLYLKTFENS